MLSCNDINTIVAEMRTLNRPLTVAEAHHQVQSRHSLLTVKAHKDAVLRVLGLIAAQEFAAAREKRQHIFSTMKVGTTLRNGASIIEAKPSTKHPGNFIVLANCGGHHPYVTWLADANRECVWGHYYETLAEALDDYEVRS